LRQDASFIPAQGIPERFVIPPLRQVIFHGVAFRRGDHLQLNAIRAAVIPPGGNANLVSFPATAAWGIDYALRGTQGVDISERFHRTSFDETGQDGTRHDRTSPALTAQD